MKRFISKAMTLVLAQSLALPAHASLTDLPNPFDENAPQSSELPQPVAPPEMAPEPSKAVADNPSAKFQSQIQIADISRKANGLVYRIELKPSTSVRKITITAVKSKLTLHETYLVTEAGQKIKVQDLSEVNVENRSSKDSEDLNSREKITAIDLRAESMQAEATIRLDVSSDESTPVLSQFRPKQDETTKKDPSTEKNSTHIICKSNGANIQPYNTIRKMFLGNTGYGYKHMSDCTGAVEASNSRGGMVVCNWNGRSYLPYNTASGESVGRSLHGFGSLENCNEIVRETKNGLICHWNGRSMSPVKISDNSTFGISDPGYEQTRTCLDVISNIHNGMICNWNGSGYSPYVVKTRQNIGKSNYGFSSRQTCIKNIMEASDGVLCNWNGYGYSPYIINSNIQIGAYDYGFKDLSACQNSANSADRGYVCNWDGNGYSQYRLSNPSTSRASFKEARSCTNTPVR